MARVAVAVGPAILGIGMLLTLGAFTLCAAQAVQLGQIRGGLLHEVADTPFAAELYQPNR